MLDHLLALSPIEFERAVARLLPYLGCSNPQQTGKAGDLGADIVCTDEHGGLVVVQCKRYAPGNNVTSPNIQQFFGMLVHHGARRGIYVMTSAFTRSAAELAAARDIRTVDGVELVRFFAAHPDALRLRPPAVVRPAHVATPVPSPVPVADSTPQEPAGPEELVSPTTYRKPHWRCLGCNRLVAASSRECPSCHYTVAPLQWERLTAVRVGRRW
jgi:hypothetical protein